MASLSMHTLRKKIIFLGQPIQILKQGACQCIKSLKIAE